MRKQEGWGQNVWKHCNLGAGRRGASQEAEQDRGNRTEGTERPRGEGQHSGHYSMPHKRLSSEEWKRPCRKVTTGLLITTPTGLLLTGEIPGSGFSPFRQGQVMINSQAFGCPCAGRRAKDNTMNMSMALFLTRRNGSWFDKGRVRAPGAW